VTTEQIGRLEVQTTDLAPERARQEALWSTARQQPEERLRALQNVAETLALRHSYPLLQTVCPTNDAAVFSEDRFAFRPITQVATDTTPAKTRSLPHRRGKGEQNPPNRLHWW
jgi:hypothetical protein